MPVTANKKQHCKEWMTQTGFILCSAVFIYKISLEWQLTNVEKKSPALMGFE